MTFIAAYANGSIELLLADTMLTTEVKPISPRQIMLPISGKTVPSDISLNEECGVYPSSFKRKAHIINDRLSIAWCNSYLVGTIVIELIKERLASFAGNPQLLLNVLTQIISELPDDYREQISLVAFALSEDEKGNLPYYVGFAANQWNSSSFDRPVFMAGSGSYIMQNNLSGLADAPVVHMAYDQPSDLRSLADIIGAIGLQHYNELMDNGGLDHAFGGPFDLVVRTSRGDGTWYLATPPEMSFTYWEVRRRPNKDISFGFTGIVIYRKYVDGYLISATERLEQIAANHNAAHLRSATATLSTIGYSDFIPRSEVLETFLASPRFQPTWNTLIFMEGMQESIRTHIHYTFDDNSLFNFSRIGDKFHMKIEQRLFEPIVEWYQSQEEDH